VIQQQHATEFEFLAESIPEILWTAQADGAVTYFNQRWMQYTGQTLAQALSWGWETIIHPQDLSLCLQRWTTALRTGEKYEVEYRFRRHDGQYRWFIGRALPLKDSAGQVLKWFGTCTDIHDQKETEQILRRREDELERAYQDLEAKVTFRTLELEELMQAQQSYITELQQRVARR
jgi:PAS domain S-box-containing protein